MAGGCLSADAASQTVSAISIQGNTLIPETTILSVLETKVGAVYNKDLLAKDIQHVYDIGLFSTVDVDVQADDAGMRVVFIVKERPIISRIEFEGNKHLKNDRIEDILSFSSTNIAEIGNQKFYPQKIQEDVANIRQLYHEQGYQNASISFSLVPDPDAAAEDKLVLKYAIQEGEKVKVRGVSFEGNTIFTDRELQKQMATRRKGVFSFITGSGKYEETTLKTDLERVKFHYADHGYIDVNVTDYKLDFKENDLFITIFLEEGPMYTMSSVAVKGNEIYSMDEVEKVIAVSPGNPFSRSKIREDILGISKLYAKKGYLTPISENTDGKLLIDPEISIDRQQKQVALVYSIREGSPHFLSRVTIHGNEVTRDKVIRRELSLQEGELMNSALLEDSRRDVFNLGLFDDVTLTLDDGEEPNTVDLDINVSERQTGSFNFGGGWSSVDNFVFSGDLSYANLFGLNHQITFSTSLGSKSQQFNLNYTMPHFLDSPYLVGLDSYKTKREYTSYDSDSIGGGLRFGRELWKNTFGTLKYEYKEVDIKHVEDDASAIIKEAEGLSKTSGVTASLRWSTINNVLLPTKGSRTILSGEFAGGILGAENDFYKFTLNHNTYFQLYRDFALRLKGEISYVKEFGDSEKVPIFERLFAGGADTIRGYEERSVGPKDENDEEIGGNKLGIVTAEVIIPVTKQVRVLGFFDMGDVYRADEDVDLSTLKKGVGVGVRFYSPLGLIRLDWGYKLDREDGDDADEFHFGIGALF